MAEPLKVLSSLDQVADRYAVFEHNQVLTPGQLNSVSSFLDDQDRLTRVNLIGVGIVAGLLATVADSKVRVSPGLGVTTDGDLLMLAGDSSFDQWKPYGADAPRYAPFHPDPSAPDTMIELFELLPAGTADDPTALPLRALPGEGLADKVLILFMESVVTASDRCNGTACDNLGGDARFRQRLLLARRADVDAWLNRPVDDPAQALPELAATRPNLDRAISTTDVLAKGYRHACGSTQARIVEAFKLLASHFPGLLAEVFGTSPTDEWAARLDRHAAGYANNAHGVQCWYGLLKDLVDTWNELREALFADTSKTLPPVGAFPKHLLLGDLSLPGQRRTRLYPAPTDAIARAAAAQARFLLRRLHALIVSFATPAVDVLRVTPSLGSLQPLGERAVPACYVPNGPFPVHRVWNYRLAAREQSGHNLGYHADQWADSARARTPLAFAIDRHDLFRIEGHLGQAVEKVVADVRRHIATHNLPFEVQAVLLHDRHHGRIRVRPPIRYTDLHSLHHLVRKDVSTRIEEGATFGTKFLDRVQEAAAQKTIPNEENGNVDTARSAVSAVKATQAAATPMLAKATYNAYRKDNAWKASIPAAFEAIGNARASLGGISRNDFTSPYDALISSNQVLWLDWLDELIDARDDRADARLLFSAFVARHPGLDHVGGVWRGGTWVVVYNDDGKVIGDFALPYPAAEVEEPEPVEPPLKLPDYKPPAILERSVRVLPPISRLVKDAFVDVKTEWNKDLTIYQAKLEGNIASQLGSRVKTEANPTGNTRLDERIAEVRLKHDEVVKATNLATRPGITDEERKVAEDHLKKTQEDLAITVGKAAELVVTEGIDLSSGQAANAAPVLVGSMGLIKEAEASRKIKEQLTTLRDSATDNQLSMIDSMAVVGGFKIRRSRSGR